jgi:hypothetical protein
LPMPEEFPKLSQAFEIAGLDVCLSYRLSYMVQTL